MQLLGSGGIDPAARVVISTVQRLYAKLTGSDIDEEIDEHSGSEIEPDQPVEIAYNPDLPIETFDVIVVDECHRSIYGVWRQVLEYFDAFLIGLTATPGKQTFGFFRQNLVVEYGREEAVADGVNVDFDVYRIRTEIGEHGATVDAGLVTKFRDKETRAVRLEKLDEDVPYDADQLDRTVVAEDQIRTVVQAFRDNLFKSAEDGGIFPGRREVPKTLVFAKSDSHADDIVRILREEFGKGNDFAVKITYRTTGKKPEDLLAEFRNSYNPRIAVTVDMIATGTDVKPLECVMFMRAVKSRTFFEQMMGRGVRTIDPNDLQAVTADATVKDHFVVVDAVGVTDTDLVDSQPLERMKTVSLQRLLDRVAAGDRDPEIVRSIAGRLARLDRQMTAPDRAAIEETAGMPIDEIVHSLVAALDPDEAVESAREATGTEEPPPEAVAAATDRLLDAAVFPLASNPALRTKLVDVRRSYEQLYDEANKDALIEVGFSVDATDRAKSTVDSFRRFIEEHHDEIEALDILYSRPHGRRLSLKAIRELAGAIGRPPYNWTPERLWNAYETLDRSKVHGSPGRVLTNLVSLVRFALEQEPELSPYPETVGQRFQAWLASQEQAGRTFTPDQLAWLARIRDHVATSLAIGPDDFEFEPFVDRGGFGRANDAFDGQLGSGPHRTERGAGRVTFDLPDTWTTASLGDLMKVSYGKALPDSERSSDGAVPYVGSAGPISRTTVGLIDGPALVIGRKGNAGSVQFFEQTSWPSDTTYYLKPPPEIDGRFLAHQLRMAELRQLDRSTALPSLMRTDLEKVLIRVAPSAEQGRIVEAIEEAFSKLDVGVAYVNAAARRLGAMERQIRESVLTGPWEWTTLDLLLSGIEAGKSFKTRGAARRL